MRFLKTLFLLAIFISCTKNIKISAQTELNVPPEMDGFGKYLNSLIKNGKNVEFANWFYSKNKHLKSSKSFVWASEYYAIAGIKDSSALCLNLALDNGMSNPKIISQKNNLSIVKNTKYWPKIESKLQNLETRLNSVSNFQIDTEPMVSFWNYFNASLKDSLKAKKYLGQYIMSGSNATREYYAHRYQSIDEMYRIMISENPELYSTCEKLFTEERIKPLREEVLTMMKELKKIYPKTIFPKVYIMPGIMDTGGTVTDLGLFVGGEKFVQTENDLSSLNIEGIKEIIMHELMHFQQGYKDKENNGKLIGKVIDEGVCDFLVELCSKKVMKNDNLEYLESEENMNYILSEFKKDLYSEDLNQWMYNYNPINRPVDIGYTLGYKICKSYYEKSKDKSKAINELLNTHDFTKILEKSEFQNILN